MKAGGHRQVRIPGYWRSVFLTSALLPPAAFAFTVSISPASTKQVYLQVGVGGFVGTYISGGSAGNNSTENKVSVTVAAAAVGNGVSQAMTTDSTVGASSYDGYAFCNTPAQMYIGGFYRNTSAGGTTATVTATVPASLTNASGALIPFSDISWTTGGNGDKGGEPFPAGTFVNGGAQSVGSIAANRWAESCWSFKYRNAMVPAQGTYVGRVLYTLSAP